MPSGPGRIFVTQDLLDSLSPFFSRAIVFLNAPGPDRNRACTNPADRAPAIREHMTAFAYAGATEALRDPEHALVKFVGATVTPEAAVYAGGHIVYRGRIDDRYVDLGLERPAPTRRDLAEALAAVIAGKPVLQPTTQAVGCFIADFV